MKIRDDKTNIKTRTISLRDATLSDPKIVKSHSGKSSPFKGK